MASRLPDTTHLIPPPPFGPAGQRVRSSSRASETDAGGNGRNADSAILTPRTGRDIVALVFLLLMVPQGLSCLVLAAYILLSTFKAMAGKTVARYLVPTQEYDYDAAERPLLRDRFYRSELVGDMLQLFSINLFILLVCHYTMPKPWLQNLVVLAKSIVASRLVGTYTTGSTTYVNVVASTSTTTTSTTTSGQTRSEAKYLANQFLNSLLGFVAVLLLNNLVGNFLLRLNLSQIVSDLVRFYTNAAAGDVTYTTLLRVVRSLAILLPKSGPYTVDGPRMFKSNLVSKFLLHILINHLGLGNRSIQTLALVLREFSVVVNYAYLVLCIHVISLTVSPFLNRIVLFKDYSRTLDHLAALTPHVPYGRPKGAPTVPENDSVVLLNVDHLQLFQLLQIAPLVLNVDSAVSRSPFSARVTPVVASNFNVFCMVPTTRAAQLGSKTSHSRTIVDRKRSNSNATPSTTIMDKYFSVSVQPLWSWLAAIKVLAVSPALFGGAPTKVKNNGTPFVTPARESRLALAVAHVGTSRVVLEILDRDYLDIKCVGVCVNGIEWRHVSVLVGEREEEEKNEQKKASDAISADSPLYLSIHGLAPLSQYEVDVYTGHDLVSHHVVCTTDGSRCMSQSTSDTPVESLQHSLKYTVESLEWWKTSFKKAKKEESKKNTELRRQIDSLRARIDKVGSKHTTETKTGGKLRGLQNSVIQLEHEIQDLHLKLQRLDQKGDDSHYKAEELQLSSEIAELEQLIAHHDTSTPKMRNDIRGAAEEKEVIQAKKKKVEDKLEARKDDIMRQSAEIKQLKREIISKLQKRQRRIQDKMGIIPRVEEATARLDQMLGSGEPGQL